MSFAYYRKEVRDAARFCEAHASRLSTNQRRDLARVLEWMRLVTPALPPEPQAQRIVAAHAQLAREAR